MAKLLRALWHGTLKRPYRLAVPVDHGEGRAVVLLHGIALDHRFWHSTWPQFSRRARVIVPDLLGFGDSPKPDGIDYTVQDHAKAVIATLRAREAGDGIVLVGHSMGALIAVEVAKQKPRMVRELIICSPPILRFDRSRRLLPDQETLLVRLARYMRREKVAMRTLNGFRRLRPDVRGLGLDQANWVPFKRSLFHTVMRQTTFQDLQDLAIPVKVLSGRFDGLVVRRHLRFLAQAPHITVTWLNEPHEVTKRYAKRIAAAVNRAL